MSGPHYRSFQNKRPTWPGVYISTYRNRGFGSAHEMSPHLGIILYSFPVVKQEIPYFSHNLRFSQHDTVNLLISIPANCPTTHQMDFYLYSYFTRQRPFAGAVGPAALRSLSSRIPGICSGLILPQPTSIKVPAMIRTIL